MCRSGGLLPIFVILMAIAGPCSKSPVAPSFHAGTRSAASVVEYRVLPHTDSYESVWGSTRYSTSFLKRIKILQHQRREKVMIFDAFMCSLAELPPHLPVLNEHERSLCTRLRLIRNITVLTIDDLRPQAGHRSSDNRLVFPHGFRHGQAKAFTYRTLEDDAGIALKGIHLGMLDHSRIVEQMDVWICACLRLYVFEDLQGIDIISRFHGPHKRYLHRRNYLFHQVIDIDYLPGIFPVAEPRNLCDERPRCVYSALSQHPQSPPRGQESIFFVERVYRWRDDMCSFRRQGLENRERGVKYTHVISIEELIDVGLPVWIWIRCIDMTHPERRSHPGKKGSQGSELKIMDEINIRVILICTLQSRCTT